MSPLSLLFGTVVGLSLGLTGGGGAIFAVPLLVYGLQVPAKDAVVISLISVGTTSFVGFLHRWQLKEVDLKTGLIFAIAGMMGAPIGTWLATLIPDIALMILFSLLMLIVAARMWQQSSAKPATSIACASPSVTSIPTDCIPTDDAARDNTARDNTATCERDAQGHLKLNTRCALLLLALGVFIGIQTGLFGVGGGFLIVPALVLYSGIPILHAVGTSLMVVSLVSVSGLTAQFYSGRTIPLDITLTFILGGILGMLVGQRIGKNLKPTTLQRTFAVAILLVAMFVLVRNLYS